MVEIKTRESWFDDLNAWLKKTGRPERKLGTEIKMSVPMELNNIKVLTRDDPYPFIILNPKLTHEKKVHGNETHYTKKA